MSGEWQVEIFSLVPKLQLSLVPKLQLGNPEPRGSALLLGKRRLPSSAFPSRSLGTSEVKRDVRGDHFGTADGSRRA